MLSFADRFWSKVDRSGGPDACWFFLGCVNKGGYGQVVVARIQRGAHVIAWELKHGPVPPGKHVCHSCDARYLPGDMSYRRCCNDAHLWLGTHQDNHRDCTRKGRRPTGDRSGAHTHPESLPRGEHHGNAVLDNPTVYSIRRRCASGESKTRIARDCGVSLSLVKQIHRRIVWKHLPDEEAHHDALP